MPDPTKSLLGSAKAGFDPRRVPMNIHPTVRKRVRDLLFEPELAGVGYSEFVARACEAAETEIAQARRHDRERG